VSRGKRLFFVGRSRQALTRFPDEVKRVVGFALYLAQQGAKHEDAKPLKGFGGTGVLEIVETHERNAYRAVYTVRFREAIYVLDAFQKKSKKGIKTPKSDVDRVRSRLKRAERHHAEWIQTKNEGE